MSLPPTPLQGGLWNANSGGQLAGHLDSRAPPAQTAQVGGGGLVGGPVTTASQKLRSGAVGCGCGVGLSLEVRHPSGDLGPIAQSLGCGTPAGYSSQKWCCGFLSGPGTSRN